MTSRRQLRHAISEAAVVAPDFLNINVPRSDCNPGRFVLTHQRMRRQSASADEAEAVPQSGFLNQFTRRLQWVHFLATGFKYSRTLHLWPTLRTLIVETTIFGKYQTCFLDLLRKLRELPPAPLEKAELCLEIQNDLFARIVQVERRISKHRACIAATTSQVNTKLPKATRNRMLARVKRWQARVKEYQSVLHALRDIGDGLAFTYIDKWDIKPMAFKESPGCISGKSGTAFERVVLEEAFQRGRIAIHNDLTNCLRYGDITIPHEGAFQIVEIKSGVIEWPRNERQMKKLVKISDYLRNDEVQGLYGIEDRVHRQSSDSDEVNHVAAINELVTRSYTEGNVSAEVEDGLIYFVAVEDGLDELDRIIDGREPGLVIMVNEFKFNNVGYVPFTISITEPEHCFDFYIGKFLIVVLVDLVIVRSKLAEEGWNVSMLQDEWPPWALKLTSAKISQDPLSEIKISRHFFGRVAAEFVSLDWILKQSVMLPPGSYSKPNNSSPSKISPRDGEL